MEYRETVGNAKLLLEIVVVEMFSYVILQLVCIYETELIPVKKSKLLGVGTRLSYKFRTILYSSRSEIQRLENFYDDEEDVEFLGGGRVTS